MLSKIVKKFFPDSFLDKYLNKSKIRSVISLVFWCMFALILYLVVLLPIQKENKEGYKKYLELKSIVDDNYHFEYSKNDIIYYEGNCINNKISGTKYGDENVSNNFFIENNKVYIEKDGFLSEYYDNLDKIKYDKYFDIKYVLDILDNSSFNKNMDFKNNNLYGKIDSDSNDMIINIIDKGNYYLKFSKININN